MEIQTYYKVDMGFSRTGSRIMTKGDLQLTRNEDKLALSDGSG